MSAWVALLRGINVSGKKIVKMDSLIKSFEALRFTDVSTYIQSGNVIFSSTESKGRILKDEIEKKLAKSFGFDVPVVLRNIRQMRGVVEANPFKGMKLSEKEKVYVTFLSEVPSRAAREELQKLIDPADKIELSGSEVYLLCGSGYAETKFTNTFLEKKLGTLATTRNLATVHALCAKGAELR